MKKKTLARLERQTCIRLSHSLTHTRSFLSALACVASGLTAVVAAVAAAAVAATAAAAAAAAAAAEWDDAQTI